MSKRKRHEEPDDVSSKQSKAARFNIHTLKRLQQAVAADPEINLASYFPKDYSKRLSEMRTPLLPPTTPVSAATTTSGSVTKDDIRVFLRPSEPIAIIFPLADSVRSLLADADMSEALVGLMRRCEILWKSPFPRKKMVFKCDGNIVIKAIKNAVDYTEYTTLQYLEVHKPTVPAPRPSGLLRMNDVSLIFMTYTSTTTLADIWAGLDISQKRSIQDQLNQILTDLRSLSHPNGMPLGGVGGEGCKDVRRHLRRSTEPILTVKDFKNFLFPSLRAPIFTEFIDRLRQPCVPPQQLEIRCVFTHGDLRPDNITVEPNDDHQFGITGLLDWEYSGFYPEYHELIKSTNGLSSSADDDWYLFLPECISPERYGMWWLLDYAQGALVELEDCASRFLQFLSGCTVLLIILFQEIASRCALSRTLQKLSSRGERDTRIQRRVTTGRIGRFNVVLVLLPNVGEVSAASTSACLLSSFPGVILVFVTGVCSAVPNPEKDKELLLGDVVIGKNIAQYDLCRQYPDRLAMRDNVGDTLGRPRKLRNLLAIFETVIGRGRLERTIATYLQEIQKKSAAKNHPSEAKYQYPGALQDKLFQASYRRKHYLSPHCICKEGHEGELSMSVCEGSRQLSCKEPGCDDEHLLWRERIEEKRQLENEGRNSEAQAPSIFIGSIGSGDTAINSGKHRDMIAETHDLLAFELEAAGVWDEFPCCIVVKAACDYADSHRNDIWQDFAAATAASATKASLERYFNSNALC
ncbi:hypothetical protein EMCG_00822 [[Emmonsia] crescens]|uniref:Aminoglycoside phosphotransferase domain-containing protein n=1 Tax=[Emmonsia] crescens TaxID=73230 RepID=A0A0G2HQP5_9EURO|nr:hypothetical protein EMCG_00822 [Emmonsia crescens UAMH 3008]